MSMLFSSGADHAASRAKLSFSLLLSTGVTLAAAMLFVVIATMAQDSAFEEGLITAVLLNAALIIFGWHRSRALSAAVAACADAEQRARVGAYSDYITGLSNRRQLVETIEKQTAAATLLLLDLDHFKRVNDSFGHASGDRLLQHVAEAIRRFTPADACCARLGGDEFAIFIPGDLPPAEVCVLAQQLVTHLAQPVAVDGGVAHVSVSIGISSFAHDGVSCSGDLMKRSDIALYEAKRLGRNCFVWFDSEMERQLDDRTRIEAEMRTGIENNEFIPFYQPQINLADGALKGFEVLARWAHPSRGLLEPSEFIGIAESTGLISALSSSVMYQALRETKTWPGDLTIAINVSPVQFRDALLDQRILKILAETGFPAARLELEITESSIMDDQEQALATVESLKNSGVSISLDDFGTGYASLTQLQSLPFDRIKIDRSFVAALLSDTQSSAIVRTIASLGRSLNLPVTAEGVESEDVRERLQSLGCVDGQGWLWGKAVPADLARALLPVAERIEPPVPLLSALPPAIDRRDTTRRPAKRSQRAV
jgi:diguanylate cyclase (GGDEF)-like protein